MLLQVKLRKNWYVKLQFGIKWKQFPPQNLNNETIIDKKVTPSIKKPAAKIRAKKMTMKDRKRRCMEMEIGDIIKLTDEEEGKIEATVTHMIWKGTGGYRIPDAMEVTNANWGCSRH